MTMTLGLALAVAASCFGFGFLTGASLYKLKAERQGRLFDRYRETMLDDWREVAGKLVRVRAMIRRSRSISHLRDALAHDDREHPSPLVGPPVVSREEP